LDWTRAFGGSKVGVMKLWDSNRKKSALTVVEVLVIAFALMLLVVIILPKLAAPKRYGGVRCENCLKQIGLSYRIWAEDNGGKYPFNLPVTNGGTRELNFGKDAWLNFLVMSNELSATKILICPKDAKHLPPATNFSIGLLGHISYFVGLDAKESDPQRILSGDDNFEINGIPVKSGLLELSSNTPTDWTPVRHGFSGNLLFADCSVQSLRNDEFKSRLIQTGLATNRLAIP
jgi:prepilin-type processing-associated H-X9-DG protein